MRVLALLDGTQADPDAPLIRVDDLGLLRGDGVFETILVVGGEPRELGPHLDRLARSAAMLDMPEPDLAAFRRAVDLVLDTWSGGPEIAVKLVCTRGVEGGDGTPTGFALGMDISPKVIAQRAGGISAVTLERGIEPGLAERAPWLLLGAKSLSYAVNMAALREAERRGADEVVFTTSSGSVLEGPTSTLVLARGRTLTTPPSTLGILPGTTQAALFRAAERAGWSVEVAPVDVAELYPADGVFLVSSVRKITRVHTLDGKALPDSTGLHAVLDGLYESEYRTAPGRSGPGVPGAKTSGVPGGA
ncbi:aminodeoxychorismate lyase [Saccharothrix longispora]|uniref:aminodeoxychorismate lyase n=1 Tax=Saccharothrix longispora TaxID=33920 RepID=UPI0028FD9571|nr:aminodeoxychorismate lyase [Saccharothrix longispora]MDU0291182.1 aminodeoxychorismate lyase [Saccharothrix longispora]